jgi:hypothetical protein
VAVNCHNTTKPGINKAEKGISFHRFPRESELFTKWVANVNRDGWQPKIGKDTRLCSDHFTSDQFEPDKLHIFGLRSPGKGPRKKLMPGAVPTLFSHKPVLKARTSTVNRLRRKEQKEVRRGSKSRVKVR